MPNGSTHDRITLWTLPFVSLATAWIARTPSAVLSVGSAYLFSGLMFAGDLDTYSRQYQRWLWLRWLWVPYRKLFRHRSFWTHGPLVGTIVRLLYLCCGLLPCFLTVAFLGSLTDLWSWQPQQWFERAWAWISNHRTQLILISCGLELGAMNHSISDWLSSFWKRRRRRRSQHLKTRSHRSSSPSSRSLPKTRSTRAKTRSLPLHQ